MSCRRVAAVVEEASRILGRARVPTLAMEGGETFPFMRGIASALAGLIPGAQARVLEGQGHYVRPEVLAPVLEEFFAD